MYFTLFELSIGIGAGALAVVWLPKCDPRPLCFGCCYGKGHAKLWSNNELLELLKTKKHVRIFVHMLKYFENENHIWHNSLCESNSLIKKHKKKK